MTSVDEPSKQVIANRKNGLKGGVKTIEGKSISSLNAKVHGIFSLRIFPKEEVEFVHLHEALTEELAPQNLLERVLIERLAFHVVQMQRVSFATNEYLLHCSNPRQAIEIDELDISSILGVRTEVIEEGYTPQIKDAEIERLSCLYHRYEVAVENRFYKALHELSKLRGKQ